MLTLLTVLIVGTLCLIVWMAGGVQGPHTFEASTRTLPAVPGPGRGADGESTVLRIVVWNIAWAYGLGSEGSGGRKPTAHFERTLDRMGRTLAALKPDLVLLQEIDFGSDRSHGTDQAERLARQCGLRHIASAQTWSANYVPFPYWPPSDHFGKMSSGGAVLSRYPLGDHRVELLPKPTANPWWYNLFYLFRYLQQVKVDHPHAPIQIVNAHLEAFDGANRINQAYRAREVVDGLEMPHLVFGGDMNAVPPESPVRHGYPDEPEQDNRDDETIATLRGSRRVQDTLPVETFTSTPSDWFTFPANAPNRKLDYIFVSDAFEVVSTRVVHEADDASDHLPVFAEVRFK